MPDPTPEPKSSWAISVAFWLALFVAAGLYAGVALSQKMLTNQDHRRTYIANQYELVRIEAQNDYLKRVADVMRNDPEFAAELARTEFNSGDDDEERIPVAHELTLEAAETRDTAPPEWNPPVYEPVLRRIADDGDVRDGLLAASAAIVLFAFVFLNESRPRKVAVGGICAGLGYVFSRYRKPPPDDFNGPTGDG